MLFIFFSLVFIIPFLMGWGNLLDKIFPSKIKGISGKTISGILFLGLIFTALSFFIALNIYVEIPVILIGLFYFFKDKIYLDFYKLPKGNAVLLCIFGAIVLYCGSSYPFILDHFGYYIPSIKWLTEVGLVKGISNLDLILGQMSMWHILQAGFSNFCDPFLKLNTILLIIYLFYIIENESWIHLFFIPVLLFFTQSPSPDLPVIVLSLIILNEIFIGNKAISFLFALSIFAFSIKPTIIWLPFFIILYSIFCVKLDVKKLIFGFCIFLLFIFKNIWTFGYPVFPVAVLDLGFSWKPNPELLHSSSQLAIVKTYDEQFSYQEIMKFSWFEYIKNWFLIPGIKSFIHIGFVLTLVGFIIFSFIKKNKIISILCISVLLKSILVLLFSAQYRFFLEVFFVVFLVIGYQIFSKKITVSFSLIMSILFCGIFTFPKLIQQSIPSFQLGKFIVEKDCMQLYKPSHYQYKNFEKFKIGNLKFNVSKQYPFNFDTPIPAISENYVFDYQKAKIFPQMIDKNNIKKGFIWKKLNHAEEKEVEKTVHAIKSHYPQTEK
ncbi:hypothetical protein [Chryseobacterium sp. RR2-3-20]|uniref:LIC_10190 family membrane protein n=1 Tax=Chryseobacterium sp. RR2-3-20 TaxID=2787626 RepID=UPI001FD8552A|nr:hypothetical protein [Chryseobacterium sp. RR2-3-20]